MRSLRRGIPNLSAWLLSGSLVSIACLGLTAIISARALGPDRRGMLAVELVYASLSLALLASGIALVGRVRLVNAKDPLRLPVFLGLVAVVGAVHAAVCAFGGLVVLPIANVDMSAAAIVTLVVYGILSFLGSISLQTLLAYGLIKQQSLIDPIGSVCTLVTTVLVSATGHGGKEQFLLALGAGGTVQALLAGRTLVRAGHRLALERDVAEWRRLTSRALRGGIQTVAQGGAYQADRYLLSLLDKPAAAGVYAVAASTTEVIRVGPWAVGQVLLYRLAEDPTQIDPRVVRRATILSTAALAVVVALSAGFIVPLVLGDSYRGAITPMRILVLGEVGLASYLIDISALLAAEAFGPAARVATAGLVAITVLDLVMIPAGGPVGAAWAATIGFTFMAVMARRSARIHT